MIVAFKFKVFVSGASNLINVSPTTATVPSSTSTSSTLPLTGEGISTTALSFCTSRSTSSSFTSSLV